MKILLIHQVFASTQEAGGTRHYELGQYLKANGDSLTVITSQVSYLTSQRIHPDRGGILYREEQDGIVILRAYTIPVHHRSFVWRVLAFIVFACASVWAGLRAGPVDVVMGTTPPIFQAFSAWLVARLRRKPFLLEVRDLWPEFAIAMGVLRNPVLIALARSSEHFLYARADHLVVNSPAYQKYLVEKGVSPDKISLVPNGVDASMFDPEATGDSIRKQYGLQDKFIVVYAGAHGMANDLGIALKAANRLRTHADIHFLFVGDGKERPNLERDAQQLNLTNVTFTGALPKAQMPDVLAAADVCLASLMNIRMFNTTYPNKVFDYMAAGRPTLLAIDGVIRDVIERANGGIFVPPGDDQALAEGVERLYHDRMLGKQMGQAAREYVTMHFDRKEQAEEFRQVFYRMIK